MKTNIRFIVAAVILACVAALGLSRGAWAGPLMQGTVPACPTSGYLITDGILTTCSSVVDVTGVNPGRIVYVHQLIPVTGGHAVKVTGQFSLVEICFPDPLRTGVIFHWVTAQDFMDWFNTVEPGRWVVYPTYHKTGGLTCTRTWNAGTFGFAY